MAPNETSGRRVVLVGCGILKKEIRRLIARNGWPVTPFFLPSALHVDFGKLQQSLERRLAACEGQPRVVFYGACHPLMDQILAKAATTRTPGQNCVDIYLGHDVFARELAAGAFFLFEDWALDWDRVIGGRHGFAPGMIREIFRESHASILAIRTPCSADFSAQAEDIGRQTSLPLRWMDAGLDHLELTLGTTIRRALEEAP